MKLVALGEILIDFLQVNYLDGLPTFVAQPGGAPANVLCAAAKLGVEGAFIGKVGADQFGQQLINTLREHGVETQYMVTTEEFPTTLAFVHIGDAGDRSFSFYREGCADTKLMVEDVSAVCLEDCQLFHFGSNSFTSKEGTAATHFALKVAKEYGATISFDPNIRMDLWRDVNDIKPSIKGVLPYVDILKVSDEELQLLTGQDAEQGIVTLEKMYSLQLIVVTLGEKGLVYRTQGESVYIAGHSVPTIDTTGAGDSFVGAMLAQILQTNEPLSKLKRAAIHNVLCFANAAAAISTTKNGAIPSLPEREEIEQFMNGVRKHL